MVQAVDIGLGQHPERRARRYEIAQPVRFRTPEGRWVNGTTVNMSATGVLIRTRHALAPATEVVLQIALSGDASFRSPQIGCSGHVARTEPIPGSDDVLLAATIDNFQLRRASSADGDA